MSVAGECLAQQGVYLAYLAPQRLGQHATSASLGADKERHVG